MGQHEERGRIGCKHAVGSPGLEEQDMQPHCGGLCFHRAGPGCIVVEEADERMEMGEEVVEALVGQERTEREGTVVVHQSKLFFHLSCIPSNPS